MSKTKKRCILGCTSLFVLYLGVYIMNESHHGSDSVGLFCYALSIHHEYEIKL